MKMSLDYVLASASAAPPAIAKIFGNRIPKKIDAIFAAAAKARPARIGMADVDEALAGLDVPTRLLIKGELRQLGAIAL
jgi:hypothetical protein